MHSSILKRARIAVMLFLVLVVASSAWAGGTWKVGDVVVCVGQGKCKVLRPGTAPATTLQDTISDAAQNTTPPPAGVSNPGDTFGVAINNTLHILMTDAGGLNNITNTTGSNIVEFQTAGEDQNGNPLVHGVATVFDGGGGTGATGIQAVALNKAGDMFVLNANGSSPVIIELDQTGTFVKTIPLSSCGVNQVTSMDLSADALYAYVTSGGTIQKVKLADGTCTPFADFGSKVALYGIKDIPGGALPPNCGSSITNPSVSCPTDEAILVVATGFVDPDTNENETSPTDAQDAVNICSNDTTTSQESCGLLLDTNSSLAGLTGTRWIAGNLYGVNTVGTSILDPFFHLQKVVTAGTSGSDEPAWSHTGGTVIDNAVIWQDQDSQTWKGFLGGNLSYAQGAIVVDLAGHVQQVTSAGSPGPGPTGPTFNDGMAGVTTTQDGLQWSLFNCGNSCPSVGSWQATTQYCSTCTAGLVIQQFVNPVCGADCGSAFFQATAPSGGATGGISGMSPPTFFDVSNNPIPGPIPDNLVTWTDEGAWTGTTNYTKTTLISGCGSSAGCVGDTNQHLWLATQTGVSGPPPQPPPFTSNEVGMQPGNGTVIDGLQWQDQATSPSIIARYPVKTDLIPAQTGLRALSLDPLIGPCTSTPPTPCGIAQLKVSNPQMTAVPAGFWMADSLPSGNFFRLDFATGNPVEFTTTLPSGSTGIQSIALYGGEGANQPGLQQFPVQSLTTTGTTTTTPTARFDFLPGASDDNALKVTGYRFPTSANVPVTAFVSAIDPASGNNDPPLTATSPRFEPCTVTTTGGQCVIWELDHAPFSGPTCAASPSTCTFLVLGFIVPTALVPDLNNVDVSLDEQFDVTTFVGPLDPGGRKSGCQLSLHTITPAVPGAGNCQYGSPMSPNSTAPTACFTKGTTIPFKFQCTNLDGTLPSQLKPRLSVVHNPGGAPLLPQLGTGGTTNYRFDFTKGNWVFNLLNPGLGLYNAYTFEDTQTVETFFAKFVVKNKCP